MYTERPFDVSHSRLITYDYFGTFRLPLEAATHISDLVTSNPAGSDGMNNTDDHIRLIKGVLKTDFPNVSGPITGTQAQINGAVANYLNGNPILPDAGAFFKTNTTDGMVNPSAGRIDLKVSGTVVASFQYNAGSQQTLFTGKVAAAVLSGAGVVPIGGMIMWLTDTLPTDGTWCWANGGTLSRTGNGAALFALWGTTYGAGDNSTTFNVVNMQEAVPVGKSTMGGATSPGLLASIAAGVKGVLGSLFGSDTTTLTASQLPSITSRNASQAISVSSVPANIGQGTNTGDFYLQTLTSAGTRISAFADGTRVAGNVASNGNNDITVTSNNTGGQAHGNLSPSRVVNFIIRIG